MHRLAAQGLPLGASVVLAFIPGCGGGGGNSVVEVFDGQCIVENIIGIGSG